MHPQDNSRGKKRAGEGVATLPPVRAHSLGAAETGQGDRYIVRDSGEREADVGQGQSGSATGSTVTVQQQQDGVGSEGVKLLEIYMAVARSGVPNMKGARRRVPSALNIAAWRMYLEDYNDGHLVDYLEYGWPINFRPGSVLRSTMVNHASALRQPEDLEHYIHTEMQHGALIGPFTEPPMRPIHISPLMTRDKRNSKYKRVIMDLSWPAGESVNDGVDGDNYIDGPATIRLPTVEYMEHRVLELGSGCFMYKTDLARGYRQLRVDPLDWPLLGFGHRGSYYLDICPPFGLKTSAMCMQRTSQAICYIHGRRGYYTRAYLDDFGGAEAAEATAQRALGALQGVMRDLGVKEAEAKICQPARVMIWLGISFDTEKMTMSVPEDKLAEVMRTVREWQGKGRASRKEMQSLLGLLQFVASVAPPARVFTNRMLQDLREAPDVGATSLSLGFKKDIGFFARLLPDFNGVKMMLKEQVACQELLQLDACLTGCGAFDGREYYSEAFPSAVRERQHPIARLELLNVVVAVKLWAKSWTHRRVRVYCDNMNACVAIRTGRSRDRFFQACVRELFVYTVTHDVELVAEHRPGVLMQTADALSRAPADPRYRRVAEQDPALRGARRVRVPRGFFTLEDSM